MPAAFFLLFILLCRDWRKIPFLAAGGGDVEGRRRKSKGKEKMNGK
jgi:hypothetical protein